MTQAELTKRHTSLRPGTIVELFELTMSHLPGLEGEPPFRWTSGKAVTLDGKLYSKMAIESEGWEESSQGVSPRPRLTVANPRGALGQVIRAYRDLKGARVTRLKIFSDYLDDGASPSPGSYSSKDTFSVERKISETPEHIVLELAADLDVEGIQLPRHQVMGMTCGWRDYRGDGCGYTGTRYFDADDLPVGDPTKDICSRSLVGCIKRHTRTVFWDAVTDSTVFAAGARYMAIAKSGANLLSNKLLAQKAEGNVVPASWGFPLDWGLRAHRVWRHKLYSELVAMDISVAGPTYLADRSIPFLLLDDKHIPGAKMLCVWLKLMSGTLGAGNRLALGWLVRDEGFYENNEDNNYYPPVWAALPTHYFEDKDLANFTLKAVSSPTPTHANFRTLRKGDTSRPDRNIPVVEAIPAIFLVSGAEPNTTQFVLRVGTPYVGAVQDFESVLSLNTTTLSKEVVDPLPFGGFVGASLFKG